MNDDHFGNREEMIARYRALQAETGATIAALRDEIVILHSANARGASMVNEINVERAAFARRLGDALGISEDDSIIAAIEKLRAQLAEVTDELEIMRHQRDQAQSVVDKARELLSYDWQCRLEDCEVGDSARNDARELEHAIAEWDRAMGCDE